MLHENDYDGRLGSSINVKTFLKMFYLPFQRECAKNQYPPPPKFTNTIIVSDRLENKINK